MVRVFLFFRFWLVVVENVRVLGSIVGSVRCGFRRLEEVFFDFEGILKLVKGLEGFEGGVSSILRGLLRK